MTPQIISDIATLRALVGSARSAGERIALVPTMGALHEGHRALVAHAASVADAVIVSIFVNPLQFSEQADLTRYPRTLEADAASLADSGVLAIWAPSVETMYPDGATETRVSAGHVGTLYEGASRPGHFDGMLTVVAKLFNLVQPDVAVFGQKDAQQAHIVRRMVADLNLPIEIDVVPTVREADGLALSSRNRFLSADERRGALALSEALGAVEASAASGVGEALAEGAAAFGDHDAVKLDYLVVVEPKTFLPVSDGYRGEAAVLVAAQVGSTRLIDNTTITL